MGAKTRTWRMSGWDSATMIDSIYGEASLDSSVQMQCISVLPAHHVTYTRKGARIVL